MRFYYNNKKSLDDILVVYVDDALVAGLTSFKTLTDEIPNHFESKHREYPPFLFAGVNINKTITGFFLEQHK